MTFALPSSLPLSRMALEENRDNKSSAEGMGDGVDDEGSTVTADLEGASDLRIELHVRESCLSGDDFVTLLDIFTSILCVSVR